MLGADVRSAIGVAVGEESITGADTMIGVDDRSAVGVAVVIDTGIMLGADVRVTVVIVGELVGTRAEDSKRVL